MRRPIFALAALAALSLSVGACGDRNHDGSRPQVSPGAQSDSSNNTIRPRDGVSNPPPLGNSAAPNTGSATGGGTPEQPEGSTSGQARARSGSPAGGTGTTSGSSDTGTSTTR
jgi:hypothetical protein